MKNEQVLPFNTAMKRSSPSTVAKEVVETLSTLHEFRSILDFGCGHGVDARFYQDHGYDATGYDIHPPFGWSAVPNRKFELVTVVFVLNVLGTPTDRIAALGKARQFLNHRAAMLVVARSVHEIESKAAKGKWSPFGDGYWSNQARGQFQHGMTPEEITELAGRVGLSLHPVSNRLRLSPNAHVLLREG